jgi:putative MATE family efflux protein
MKDLTQGSIPRHLVSLTAPIMAGMVLQTLYFFVDLYFVSSIGDAALAGVSAAGNLMFVVFFFTQMLGVGTGAMVAHAVGRKDRAEANHVFNQSVAVGALFATITLVGGYALVGPYTTFFAPDDAAREQGATFLHWFLPNLAMQYAIVVMASGLRGTGIVKPAMAVQAVTVVMNTILAPILIAGWGTGKPLGVAGAGLATSLSVAVGTIFLLVYFVRLEHYVGLDRSQMKPDMKTWLRMANIGLPAGGEFGLMAVFSGVMYWAARDFGTAAQAGLGIGFRVNQMLLVPGLAIAFAAAPIAGQNFGARHWDRVRATLGAAVLYIAVAMALLGGFVHWKAEWLARIFSTDPPVVAMASDYLTYLAWNYVPAGVAFCCSSVFQGIGNTWPAFGSSAIRLVTFVVPALWMAHQPSFDLRSLFSLSVATVFLHAVVSCVWLRYELARRLR